MADVCILHLCALIQGGQVLNAHAVKHSGHLDFEPGDAFDRLVGASIHYRIASGPNAGRTALTLRTVPVQPEPFPSTLFARQPGFSLPRRHRL